MDSSRFASDCRFWHAVRLHTYIRPVLLSELKHSGHHGRFAHLLLIDLSSSCGSALLQGLEDAGSTGLP